MKTIIKSGLMLSAMVAAPSFAAYTVDINEDQKISFGGYFKVDARHVSGDIGYRDFWVANNAAAETSKTRIHAQESRFNIKYQYSDVTGYLEWDWYGSAGSGTNETLTGGHSLRLRHAFIAQGNWKVGQTWSTFMPLSSIAEALDFGGAHVAQSFVRQSQIRYTNGGLELAVENPSTQTGAQQKVPDLVGRYTLKGDWGKVAVAAVVRNMENGGNAAIGDGSQVAYNVHGRIKTFGKDDFRFSYNGGQGGKYIAPAANLGDLAGADGKLHDVEAITVAYRHFWTETLRSNLYYGAMKIDALGADRSHVAVNLLTSINPKTTVGIEVGNYETESGDSNYFQLSAKYAL